MTRHTNEKIKLVPLRKCIVCETAQLFDETIFHVLMLPVSLIKKLIKIAKLQL